jgi:hypothetical protein
MADRRRTHRTAYSAAITGEILRDLAEILGVELVFIDAGTQMGRFRQQLHRSQAYYRLTQGFQVPDPAPHPAHPHHPKEITC